MVHHFKTILIYVVTNYVYYVCFVGVYIRNIYYIHTYIYMRERFSDF